MTRAADPAGRVVVVDDERNVRRLLVEVLSDEGFQASALEGVAELRAHLAANAVDLVLLDVCLPGEDGLQWLRATKQRPAVVMMTSPSEETASKRILDRESTAPLRAGRPPCAAAGW